MPTVDLTHRIDFEIRFYEPRSGGSHSHLDRFEDGVEEALKYLKDPRHSDFALAVGPVNRGPGERTLMLERQPDAGALVQIFVPERMSPEGEDGWYNLVEPANFDRVSIKDVSTIYEEPDRQDMVQTRLSEGVVFSRDLYVTPELAGDALTFYLERGNLRDALKNNPWKFIGLI
jgi:hypothetical protein